MSCKDPSDGSGLSKNRSLSDPNPISPIHRFERFVSR